jgi:beta-1,4-mannooligosaccharide/beta-1,4-mannosyl-N-acetylglucosamine phosphorylase
VDFKGIEEVRERIYHVYDCRITRLEGAFYVMFAMDMDGGCRLGLARTADLREFRFLGITATDDVRNGVLFPEKVGGLFLRLERPNRTRPEGGPATGSEIWLAGSDDLLAWRRLGPVMRGRFHYWDELIGSGPPPVKTRKGWLHVYHGVATHFAGANVYQAGVSLLDLADPSKVLGRSRGNILEPREAWELCGQVPNVVFPSGMVVEELDREGFARGDSPVKIYYGAADTVVGLAATTVAELIEACSEPPL